MPNEPEILTEDEIRELLRGRIVVAGGVRPLAAAFGVTHTAIVRMAQIDGPIFPTIIEKLGLKIRKVYYRE